MEAVEITLIIAGIIFVVGSFFIKDKLSQKDIDTITDLSEKELKIIVDKQLKSAQNQVEDYVDEAIDATTDKTKRDLEKTTNEKIMAINEYSDTVLDAINKSHNEIMFLYSMLNDKHSELTGLAGQLQKVSDEIKSASDEELQAAVISTSVANSETENPVETQSETATAIIEETEPKQQEKIMDTNHNLHILELHRNGVSDVEIAKELGLGLGEVRLVIGLFKGEDKDEI